MSLKTKIKAEKLIEQAKKFSLLSAEITERIDYSATLSKLRVEPDTNIGDIRLHDIALALTKLSDHYMAIVRRNKTLTKNAAKRKKRAQVCL
jgi:hypothetical protein